MVGQLGQLRIGVLSPAEQRGERTAELLQVGEPVFEVLDIVLGLGEDLPDRRQVGHVGVRLDPAVLLDPPCKLGSSSDDIASIFKLLLDGVELFADAISAARRLRWGNVKVWSTAGDVPRP